MKLINKNYIRDNIQEIILNFNGYSISIPVKDVEELVVDNIKANKDGTSVANFVEIKFNKNTWYSDYVSLYSELREKNVLSLDIIGRDIKIKSLYVPYKPMANDNYYNQYLLYRLEGNELYIKFERNNVSE